MRIQNRTALVTGAALAGLGLVVGCVMRVDRVVYVDRATGERVEGPAVAGGRTSEPPVLLQRTVEVKGRGALNVSVGYGAVTVKGDPAAKEIVGTVQVAEELPGDAQVELSQTGLNISSKAGGKRVMVQSASFVVPAETAVALQTGQGDAAVSGIRKIAKLDVHASSGAVSVSDCLEIGEMAIGTSYGKVSLTGASAKTVSVASGQGDMQVQGVEGLGTTTVLTAKASSGAITVQNLKGFETLQVGTSYGKLEVSAVGTPSLLELSSGQGDMVVRDVKGAGGATMRVNASSGALTLEQCTGFGVVEGATSYGRVQVTAVTPVKRMVLKSGQGDATVAGVMAEGAEAKEGASAVVGAELTIAASSGAISISGCNGFAAMGATTSYGAVSVKDVEKVGTLSVSSGRGDATLTTVKADGDVAIAATSGNVSATGVVCKKLGMKTGYGNVALDGCESGETSLESGQGEIRLKGTKVGKLSLKGKVAMVDWQDVVVGK